MFADDLKLVADATNINDISNDLIELENWEDLWQLRFNASKCKVMHLKPNFFNKTNFNKTNLIFIVEQSIYRVYYVNILETC